MAMMASALLTDVIWQQVLASHVLYKNHLAVEIVNILASRGKTHYPPSIRNY
jgi:hypothetical protein